MTRGIGALSVGIAVPLVFPGIPILAFLVAANHTNWTAKTWVAVLIPNVVLLALVGGVAARLYLFATRKTAQSESR